MVNFGKSFATSTGTPLFFGNMQHSLNSYSSIFKLSTAVSKRSYVTRAHPRPKPTHHVKHAVGMVLEAAQERRHKREARWERNLSKRMNIAESTSNVESSGSTEEKQDPDAAAISTSDTSYRGAEETVEIVVQTGLDPRKPNQTLRGSVPLPHGIGKKIRVAVFTSSDEAQKEALNAGATLVGGDDLIDGIKNATTSITDFDRAIASEEMVSKLGKIARILGPRGLMPNPKLGTVTSQDDLKFGVKRQMSGLVNYRVDKTGNIHAPIGKTNFEPEQILDNLRVFMNEIVDKKPDGSKGTYLKQVYITATQGKSVKMDLKIVDPGSATFMMDLEEDVA
eukprot:CAMPEP_0195514154 /NCGR_PEP_ID=MMETSP0794_2-20130614/5622_1 /TAXON_ID=515487 /ORGANISM="Stephanopyxis turris, Strain CCMP 815" /LENGTH=336 /DNA_ID=CAMNT_0040642331 /DNA_START=210 /DNA_END=1220 /DNA_ORIENTATION=-